MRKSIAGIFHTRKHHLKYYERNLKNDIKYRGPLSYRYLRIIAWFFMLCFILGTFATAFGLSSNANGFVRGLGALLTFFGSLALPCFLIANFAIILTSKSTFKRQFTIYGLCALALLGLNFLFIYRYLFYIMNGINDPINAMNSLTDMLNKMPSTAVQFNLFIDLLLCLFVWFFLCYKPKKYFQGKKLVIFRLFVLIPVIYELLCIFLKIVNVSDQVKIPFYVFPFLTSKPPLSFVAFLLIAFYLKYKEKRFVDKTHSEAKYNEYLQTNHNSWEFSKITSIIFIIVGLADLGIAAAITSIVAVRGGYEFSVATDLVYKTGLGSAFNLIFCVPLILLFSYTKKHKPSLFDTLLPAAAVVLIFIICLEILMDVAFLR